MFRRASSAQWRNLVAPALAQMGIASWEYNLKTGELWWSENSGPLLGRPTGYVPADFGEAEQLFVAEPDRPHGRESVVQALEAGPIEVERRAIHPDGTTRWTYHRYFLMVGDEGEPQRLAGVMMDIDARKRRQQEDLVLLDASRVLAESLEVSEISKAIAGLLVPEIADWCIVDLVEDGVLRPLTVAHTDPSKVKWAEAMRAEYPPDPDAPSGAAMVVRTGEPEIYPDIPDEMLVNSARDERHLEFLRSAGIRSAMVLPLRTRQQVIGAATLVMAESRRRFDEESLRFAQRLFGQTAATIDNAHLMSQLKQAWANERVAVETLQRGLAPGPLPSLEGIELAAHYQIGGSDSIGGDWYEVFENEEGDVFFVIGDVVGRGVEAVEAMSRYRNGLRVLIMEGHGPAQALGLLHRTVGASRADGSDFATVACLRYRPQSRELIWSTAGHPPAMVRREAGVVDWLWEKPDPPLGVGSGEYTEGRIEVTPGMLLVLYTDGLVERRNEDLDVSLDRLTEELASGPTAPDEVVSHLTERLPSYPSTDDVAIVVARFTG